ncbi:MAG: preprotein translocase subunit SecG [Deltaproteobacteria bacterium]|jgi:preprotein translocase subunit SecG|nr:preprotein translocase subunit SecG [Deltaproteobacteria bacterium]MDP3029914.1 preprotein translocase subunit SecG [Deltaproteobacteria bacterium]TSA13021.1 MAG: preprotein translocase subunit SecG [Deltaproteobacteria bacterium]
MYTLVVVLHILVCLFLIAIVLLQTGKGADIGAVFGGSSQTLFGSAGPGTFLSKLTAIAAVIFMVTSLGLAYLISHRETASVVKGVQSAPVAPAPLQTQPAFPKPPMPAQPQTK